MSAEKYIFSHLISFLRLNSYFIHNCYDHAYYANLRLGYASQIKPSTNCFGSCYNYQLSFLQLELAGIYEE
jgi:hypothetical protein